MRITSCVAFVFAIARDGGWSGGGVFTVCGCRDNLLFSRDAFAFAFAFASAFASASVSASVSASTPASAFIMVSANNIIRISVSPFAQLLALVTMYMPVMMAVAICHETQGGVQQCKERDRQKKHCRGSWRSLCEHVRQQVVHKVGQEGAGSERQKKGGDGF